MAPVYGAMTDSYHSTDLGIIRDIEPEVLCIYSLINVNISYLKLLYLIEFLACDKSDRLSLFIKHYSHI